MSKNVAFWGTVLGFGIFNFFMLKILIGGQQNEDEDGENNDEKSKNKKVAQTRDSRGRRNTANGNRMNNNRNNNDNTSNRNNRFTLDNQRGNNNNSSAANRRMRGGAFIRSGGQGNIFDSFIVKFMSEINTFLLGKSHADDPHMAFVKSIGSGISLCD